MNLIFYLKPKKAVILLFFLAAFAVNSYSQITSLSTAYFFANSTTPFTPISGGVNVPAIQVDDAASGLLPIGFTFTYLGVGYTNLYASSNGILSFGAANSSTGNNLSGGTGRPILAPLWDDLHGASGTASYTTTGTPGSRVFTFEWLNWRWFYTVATPTISFQCKLYEATGAIEFIYRQESTGLNGSETASIGITDVPTGSGNFLSLNNFGTAPVPSLTTETTTINAKPINDQHYIFTPLNNPDPSGGTSGPPVTIPPIASFAYNHADTIWLSSPRTIVNTSNGASSSYWDIIGYNPTNKYGSYTPVSLPRQPKNSNGINDNFLDTVKNKVNLDKYVFDTRGYYRLKLVALNQFGIDTYIDTIFVDTPSSKPHAEFFADRRLIGAYDFANMYDLTSNGPVSWYWYLNPPYYNPSAPFFNNFSPTTGTQNPILNAYEGGLFDVCLVATNFRGKDTMCKPGYIKVISGYEVCKGTSTAKDTIATENEGSAKLATVAGLYIPSLIGSCSKGFTIATCSDTITLFIDRFKMRSGDSLRIHSGSLSGPIVARYGGSVVPAAFLSVKIPGGTAYLETFLGSNTGTGDSGYVVRWAAPLASYPKPTAAFSIPDTIYDSYTVRYLNQSTGRNVTYAWDTDGDGVYGLDNPSSAVDSITTNPSRSFRVFLPYKANICLKATNCKGSDTACKQVQFLPINAVPSAEFTVNRTSGFTTDIFRFTDRSQNGPNKWQWIFVPNNVAYLEGTDSSSQNPVVYLNSATNYDITLIATNSMGSNTKTKLSYVSAIAFGSPGCSGCPTAAGVPFLPSSLDIGISRVTLADMDTATALSSPIYDALYNVKKATLYRGVTYTLSTFRITNSDPMSTRAWIDYNRNTNFGDIPSEVIISENGQNKTITTGTFTVPGNTVTGNTRMRIGVTYGNTDISYQVTSLGCFEEYGIEIGIDLVKPVLSLIGSQLEKVEVHKPYIEKGVVATDNLEGDISSRFEVIGQVDTGKVGYYTLKYIVRDLYGNVSDTVARTVQVEVNQTGPSLTLNGPDSMAIEVYNSYTEQGAIAISNTGSNLTNLIVKTGMVDTAHLGTYYISYRITDQFGFSATKTRKVIVRDIIAPVILTNAGTSTIMHQVGQPYNDPVTVTDNYWTGLTAVRSGVINPMNPGTYNLVYNATDGSGNAAIPYPVTVVVRDLIPPTATLNGDNPMIVDVYTSFVDPWVTASDNYDVNPPIVRTSGSPKMNQLGTDTITYYISDAAQNTVTLTRMVVKVDRIAPEIELFNNNGALVLCRFTPYVDPGVKLTDNYYTEAQLMAALRIDTNGLDMTIPGLYFVNYDVTDGSGNRAERKRRLVQVIECATGIEEINGNSNVSVYPNPGKGLFTVSTKNNMKINTIKVMDVLGKTVYTKAAVNTTDMQIDLTTMNKGLYLIILEDGSNKAYSGRIVIE